MNDPRQWLQGWASSALSEIKHAFWAGLHQTDKPKANVSKWYLFYSFQCCYHNLLFSHSVVSSSFVTPWTIVLWALLSWDFPGKNVGLGCHFLLQEIFMTQGWILGLLHWQVDSLPLCHNGKKSTCQWRRHKRCGLDPWLRKTLWSRKWQPTPVFLPGKFHGQRSLGGCHLWDPKEPDMTEHTHRVLHLVLPPECRLLFSRPPLSWGPADGTKAS